MRVYWLLDKLEIQEYEDGEKINGEVYETDVKQKTDAGAIYEPFETPYGDLQVEVIAEHIKNDWSRGQGPFCSNTNAKLRDSDGRLIYNHNYNMCLVEETIYTQDGHDLTSCPLDGQWRRKKDCDFNQPVEITEDFKDYIEDSQ